MYDGINLQTAGYLIFLCIVFLLNNILEVFIIGLLIVLISFSYLNFKNKCFLGDSGTYFCATLFALILIKTSNKNIFYADQIIFLLIIPMLDMIRVIILRLIRGKHPFKGDKTHLHHIIGRKINKLIVFIIILSLNIVAYLSYLFLYQKIFSLLITLSLYLITLFYFRKKMRFEFGKNWKNFLNDLDKKIEEAERSLLIKLKLENLNGYKFLDIGCGSGLFSLAAKNLGAKVTSFDFDFDAVDCAKILKEKYYKDDPDWKIDQGSVLDRNFLNNLGSFDIIYSWGVLHHTGDMWRAIDNVKLISEKNCLIFISIYNYQKFFSSFWTLIKKIYNKFYYLRFFDFYFFILSIISKFVKNDYIW